MADPMTPSTEDDGQAQSAGTPRPRKPVDPIPPEARAFQGLRAGVVSRTIAGGVDYALVIAATLGSYVAYAVLAFLVDPRDYHLPTWSFGVFLLIGFSLMFSYLTVAFATTGRTVGAALMGLRVVGRKGRRLHWSAALLRAGFCVVLPIGLFWAVVSRQNRSVQDIVLRTSVIHDWPHRHDAPVIADVDVEARRIT
jgi:uncharacterized RDD family membrane protein YckC